MNRTVFNCTEEDFVEKPLYNRFSKTDNLKGGPQKHKTSVSDDKFNEYSTCQSNDSAGSFRNPSEHSVEFESEIISPMKFNETPKVNGKNWDEMMERELGKGYSFIKKKVKLKKQRVFNTGNGVAKPVWNNANRVNHANHFVPRPVQLNAVRPNSNSVRPNVNTVRQNVNSVRSNVNTVRPKQPVPTSNSNSFSPVRPQGKNVKLVKKVKKMEVVLKRRHVVLTDSEDEDAKNSSKQGRNLQEEGLDEMVRSIMKDKSEDFETPIQGKTSRVADISPEGLEEAELWLTFEEIKSGDDEVNFGDESIIPSLKKGCYNDRERDRRNRPMTQAEQREYMIKYLKSQANNWKMGQLKKLKPDELKEEFDKCINLQAEVFKKQKITDVPDVTKDESVKREEEFKVQQPILRYNIRKSLARKGLQKNKSESTRFDTEEDVEAYMDERVDEPSSEEFQIGLLNDLTRDDLKKLYRLMMLKYGDSRPEEEYKRVLWLDLKTMFDPPSTEDAVWSLTHQQKVLSWIYFHSCAVHCLTLEAAHIYMLTEVKYPLPSRVCQAMLEKRLIGDRKDECMTRSLTKELLTPFKNPEREFRSSRKLFKTLSLDESRSPVFGLFSDIEKNSEEEVAKTMAKTMEEYMSKTQANYRSGVTRPKIDDKDYFELKGQFLKELRDNTFNGLDHEDANEHIEKFLEIVDLFHVPNITQDQIRLRAFPMSLTGAASHWLRNGGDE
ncbi:hypothetical protein Tco_0223390 [Tanacetum coccineum]